ncbi:MAG: TetR/AcrR family transcriptional regulator [Candidatus Omnitrophica bacterium]|nr:TetR/AcrR family transcriptional regulator [Candidatus Omnitrophota bacterium]
MVILDRKQRDKLLRKADILKAAERVFAQKGYHNTTVDDISKEAQYAVGTLYLYFKNKQDIYLTLIEEKMDKIFQNVREVVSKAKTGPEKLRALVETHLTSFEENEDFFRIYFSERPDSRWIIRDRMSKTIMEKFMRYATFVSELIKDAQRDNSIKREFDPKRIAFLLIGMMNATIFPWLRDISEKKESLKTFAPIICEVFFKGVTR